MYGQTSAFIQSPDGPVSNYSTAQGDGTAARATDTTITFTGPTITSGQLRRVVVHGSTGVRVYQQGRNNVVLTMSAGVITIAGAGTAPVPSTTTEIEVMWVAQEKAYDSGVAASRTFNVNDLSGKRISVPMPLITTNQTYVTSTWTDLGPEVAVDGYNRATLWICHINNQNTGTQFRALAKHTLGHVDEFAVPIEVTSLNPLFSASLDGSYFQLAQDADLKFIKTWKLDNTVPYLQFQCRTTTSGSSIGNVASASYTLGWS